MHIARIVSATSLLIVSAQAAYADDPRTVGSITGTFFYDPPDRGDVTGEELNIADDDGSEGSYTLGAGEANTVVSGTIGTPHERSPRLGVGTANGAEGSLTVSGAGAVMRMLGSDSGSTMDIGNRGKGVVSVGNGGRLEVLAPSNTNSASSSSIQIGKIRGDGTLEVDNGSVLVSSPLDAFLFAGALALEELVVGGTSTVSFSNGSTLEIEALAPIAPPEGDDISEAAIVLGQVEGSSNEMTVDASTVSVTAAEGYAGLSVAREADSTGTFVLRNGSVMSIDANTNGADNAQYSGAFVQVGRDSGTNGALTIESGAALDMTSNVDAGFIGVGVNEGAFGTLTVSGGGSLTYDSAANDGLMQVGQNDPAGANGGVGFVTVTGATSTLDFDGLIQLGNVSGSGSSTGIMTVSDGGSVSAETIAVHGGGILRGGSVNADVEVHAGGILAPGNTPGTLDILGDLRLGAGSILEIEIAGTSPGEFDILNVSGNLFAEAPFSLTMSFIDGFMPESDSTFDFLNVSGGIDGFFEFAEVDVRGGNGFSPMFESNGQGGIAVSFTRVQPIPLPASSLLLLSGFGAIATFRRRNRRA